MHLIWGRGLWRLMPPTTRGPSLFCFPLFMVAIYCTLRTRPTSCQTRAACFTWWGGLALPLQTGPDGGPASAGWTAGGEALLGSAPATKLPWWGETPHENLRRKRSWSVNLSAGHQLIPVRVICMQITGFTRPAVNTPNSTNLLFNSLSSTPSLTSWLSSTLHHNICF